jgi:hypothetical protein
MANKKSKKRTKRYSGEDAKHLQTPTDTEPVVHRYTAVQRSGLGQWWFEKKRVIKPLASIVAIGVVGVWLLIELFRIVF